MAYLTTTYSEGTGQGTKTDEFSERSKQPLTPPPSHFRKIILQFFPKKSCFKPCLKVQNLQYKFLDRQWPTPLASFPKNHPFWYPDPSKRTFTFMKLKFCHIQRKSTLYVDWKWKYCICAFLYILEQKMRKSCLAPNQTMFFSSNVVLSLWRLKPSFLCS